MKGIFSFTKPSHTMSEIKKRGRPAGSANKDKPAPQPQTIIVSYRLFWGKKLMAQKRTQLPYSHNFAEIIEAKEQRDADLWAASKIHVNVRSEYLDQAFEEKRIPVSIVPFWHIIMSFMLVLFCQTLQAQDRWLGAFIDSTTKESVSVSYDGTTVQGYYPRRKEIKIIEKKAFFRTMPKQLEIDGITLIHRTRSTSRNSAPKG